MIPAIVGIPIKPFGVAKQRLAAVLDAKQRSSLGRAIAARTASVVAEAGALPVVVASDEGVMRWAKGLRLDVLPEVLEEGPGLNRAALSVAGAAGHEGWAIVHADLPLANAADFAAVWDALDTESAVIVPAHDGGTNVLAAREPIEFAYGPGSFTTHLRRLDEGRVLSRVGLAYDLDTPHDLDVMRRLEQGRWLASLLDVIEASPAAR